MTCQRSPTRPIRTSRPAATMTLRSQVPCRRSPPGLHVVRSPDEAGEQCKAKEDAGDVGHQNGRVRQGREVHQRRRRASFDCNKEREVSRSNSGRTARGCCSYSSPITTCDVGGAVPRPTAPPRSSPRVRARPLSTPPSWRPRPPWSAPSTTSRRCCFGVTTSSPTRTSCASRLRGEQAVAMEPARAVTGRVRISTGKLRLARALEPMPAVLISINASTRSTPAYGSQDWKARDPRRLHHRKPPR